MKKILFFCIFIFLFSNAFAAHISGGEMSYVYLGPGTLPGTLKYQVTLKMYRDCNSTGAALDNVATFTVFNTLTSAQFLNIQNIPGSAIQRIQKTPVDPLQKSGGVSHLRLIVERGLLHRPAKLTQTGKLG